MQTSFTTTELVWVGSWLTEEVGDGLEGLLLAHNHADSFLLFVTHELAISNATLFPLLLAEAVKLDSHFENALEVLSASLNSNLGQVNLQKGSVRGARHLLGP